MSGSEHIPVICWDSCILLAWFNREQDKALDLIEGMLRTIGAQKTNLLLSVVSFAEVLDKAGESGAGTEFVGFVKRRNVIVANVDVRIALLAREIREVAIAAADRGELTQSVKIPDALIAATAIIYRAEELYTYDPILLEVGKQTWPVLRGLRIIRPEDVPAGPLFPTA